MEDPRFEVTEDEELGGRSKLGVIVAYLEVEVEAEADPEDDEGGFSRDSGLLCLDEGNGGTAAAVVAAEAVTFTAANMAAAAAASRTVWFFISCDAFWYSNSYCFISSFEMRNLENSPSRFVSIFRDSEAADEEADDEDGPMPDKFGMLEADESTFVASRVTPASTRNSFADGSRFSRLDANCGILSLWLEGGSRDDEVDMLLLENWAAVVVFQSRADSVEGDDDDDEVDDEETSLKLDASEYVFDGSGELNLCFADPVTSRDDAGGRLSLLLLSELV